MFAYVVHRGVVAHYIFNMGNNTYKELTYNLYSFSLSVCAGFQLMDQRYNVTPHCIRPLVHRQGGHVKW